MRHILSIIVLQLLVAAISAECAPPTQTPSVEYQEAATINPVETIAGVAQPDGWRETVSVDGITAVIRGWKTKPGNITVSYLGTEKDATAYLYKNYFYPKELRLSVDKRTLYIVSEGTNGVQFQGTQITEFDLVHRVQIKQYWIHAESLW